ncbi:MAG: SRPBCC family protein [Ardenticatenaceae bacterium]|nr:SRPBCC family protein [Ardenticatenaceae bacterium]MCB8987736.1 SRPBCC family protein [Ardenticatenaceae bacterium]
MANVSVSVSREVEAPAEVVYNILADYEQHRQILPEAYFTGLEIEAGGVGAGTRVLSGLKILGREQPFRLVVSEPDPGRVLVETNEENGLVTTFTVQPIGTERSHVTFHTVWQPGKGLTGLFEKYIQPSFLRRVYHQEQDILNTYAQQQNKAPS